MDDQTYEALAELICGDMKDAPVYRSGSEISRFFERAGVPRFRHDGSTRKWWTKDSLKSATSEELTNILKRIASPKEYSGNPEQTRLALNKLNEILRIEGYQIKLVGVDPVLEKGKINFEFKEEEKEDELKPLPPPNFMELGLESGIEEILAKRWEEAQICVDKGAYLASLVIMGSLLEGLLLGVFQKFPKEVNQSKIAPIDTQSGKPKNFADWSLSQMIDCAHELGWFDLDIQKFSHALRFFRNLIHPYQQFLSRTIPDDDTCKISWLVVQAAVNDLAKVLINKNKA
jgi:hypothetical protein